MIHFLFGLVIGWLIALTLLKFRGETERKEVWKVPRATITPANTPTYTSLGTAVFLEQDRVGEIIKGKEDVKLDDILTV